MKSSRRSFMISVVGVASSLVLPHEAWADAAPVLESDANAQSLGYRTDAGKVDRAKYPKFQAGQTCANCQFFQGKPTDASALCALFGAKQVSGTGWCNAYQARA